MLGEDFEIWPIDPLFNVTLIIVDIYVTNLGYLKNRSPYFTELPDSVMEKLNKILVGLDTATVIPDIDDQDLSDRIDSKVEQAKKKKEKVERH